MRTRRSLMLLFSHSAMSHSLQPHGLQHSRLPCPSPSLRVYSLTSIESMMSSNHLILYLPQSFPVSGTFPRSCLFALGGQRIRAPGISRCSRSTISPVLDTREKAATIHTLVREITTSLLQNLKLRSGYTDV